MIASNLLLCKESALGFDGPEKKRETSATNDSVGNALAISAGSRRMRESERSTPAPSFL